MKKALRYLQNQAAAVSQETSNRQVLQSPLRRNNESIAGGSAPSNYILVKLQTTGTKPGEIAPVYGVGDLAHRSTLDKHQSAANAVIAAGLEKHQYAYESVLQGYDVYVPDPCAGVAAMPQEKKIWVVYIHGGYWCNPQELAWTFTATRAMILTHPSLKKIADQIAGYASVNYRLSQHSNFPQDRSRTSDYEMRDAKHPDHINDVLNALRTLQKRHEFGDRYLLLGHGCGAMMAMQVAMSRQWTRSGPMLDPVVDDDVKPPIAILGIDGLYDIPLLRNRNTDFKSYRIMIEGAFGDNEKDWEAASPSRWTKYANSWQDGRLVMLVHSREDELVDWSQLEAMERSWSGKQQWGEKTIEMRIQEIKGRHAEIWQKGAGMAGPIAEVILSLKLDEDDVMHH